MTDNELIELFLPIITTGLTALGYEGVVTQQNYEPTMQGINTAPTVYFYKVSDHRYGFLDRTNSWDAEDNEMVHSEIQQYETTFQVSALVTENPSVISYTASDLVNSVASIMQSDSTLETLNASKVGILRVEEVKNPYLIDDRDRYEASPSFDFTLIYERDIITTVPIILLPIKYLIQEI